MTQDEYRGKLLSMHGEILEEIRKSLPKESALKSESFQLYNHLLTNVESRLNYLSATEKTWMENYEWKYYLATARLFRSFYDVCEKLHDYDLACSTVRSIADRLAISALIFNSGDVAEKKFRLALFALDTIDSCLDLLKIKEENTVVELFSTEEFELERLRELNEWRLSFEEVITDVAPQVECFDPEDIINKKNWKFRRKRQIREKKQYSWIEMYAMIPYGKICGIEKYFSNLSQATHGLFGTAFKFDENKEENFYTPLLFATDLLICFSQILNTKPWDEA
ncbi:MAG: hypothetical protein MJZ41_12300 [Bacteroidaceae bacterium]|nr:hypothetical protein [Bacteroidaceae bacterium]